MDQGEEGGEVSIGTMARPAEYRLRIRSWPGHTEYDLLYYQSGRWVLACGCDDEAHARELVASWGAVLTRIDRREMVR